MHLYWLIPVGAGVGIAVGIGVGGVGAGVGPPVGAGVGVELGDGVGETVGGVGGGVGMGVGSMQPARLCSLPSQLPFTQVSVAFDASAGPLHVGMKKLAS
jgi:hypothetical protein